MATLRTPLVNMKIALNQELTRGLQAAADQWNITPAAAAKRILKQALQQPRPPPPTHRYTAPSASPPPSPNGSNTPPTATASHNQKRSDSCSPKACTANPTPNRKVTYKNPTPKRVTVRIPPDLNQNIQTQANTWEKQWAPTATDLILTAYFKPPESSQTAKR